MCFGIFVAQDYVRNDNKKVFNIMLDHLFYKLFRFTSKLTKHAKLLVSLQCEISRNEQFVLQYNELFFATIFPKHKTSLVF
jgi:hypothetical protein